MSVEANEAPIFDSVCASISSWITLAGYLVLPGTFTKITDSTGLRQTQEGRLVQSVVKNTPLLPLSIVLCVLGLAGSAWFWWKWRNNFIWITSKVFA